MYDLIIAGAGPAGLTAAIYAARGGFNALTVERAFVGGQVAISSTIENYPGVTEAIPGELLSNNMKRQAERVGANIVTEDIKSFSLTGEVKTLTTSKNTYEAKTVILAMGASPRLLGIKGELELAGAGVSFCATCDGAFFKNSEVIVIGGGNTAAEDALYLSNFCSKVTLIHRRSGFRAQRVTMDHVFKTNNIEVLTPVIPLEILGENAVKGVLVEDKASGEKRELPARGVFVAIGRTPKTGLIAAEVTLDSDKYIAAGEDCKTNIPGVFCAGDIRSKRLRQIVTAAADGAVAVSGVEEYLY